MFQFRQGHHFGMSLAPRPLSAIGGNPSFVFDTWGLQRSLHYDKTGVTEQELDGWSTTQMERVTSKLVPGFLFGARGRRFKFFPTIYFHWLTRIQNPKSRPSGFAPR